MASDFQIYTSVMLHLEKGRNFIETFMGIKEFHLSLVESELSSRPLGFKDME
jgi:hypothetical protein